MEQWLEFHRILITQGELWRLVTGHFTHLGPTHWLINLSGLLFVMFINPLFVFSRQGLGAVLFLCLWVSTGLWFLDPDLIIYRGFSGVLHGLFFLAVITSKVHRRYVQVAVLSAFSLKVMFEQLSDYEGSAFSFDINGVVVYNAHLYGFLGGALLTACYFFIKKVMGRKSASHSR